MRLLSAIIIGVAALVISIALLGTSTALAHTTPEMTYAISQQGLVGREVPIGLDRSLLIQAAVPLTDPDLDIILDCPICPDDIDIDNNGTVDFSWEASGQGRVRGARGRFKGQGFLSTSDTTVAFRFRKINRAIGDENGAPVGFLLSGRARRVTEGEGTGRDTCGA